MRPRKKKCLWCGQYPGKDRRYCGPVCRELAREDERLTMLKRRSRVFREGATNAEAGKRLGITKSAAGALRAAARSKGLLL